MSIPIKFADRILDDRFILGKMLIEINFRGIVVEKNPRWGYILYKVEHKSEINPDREYLIVEDQTENK